MEVAFASRTEDKKSSVTSEPVKAGQQTAENAFGAAEGMPLFLQTSLLIGERGDPHEQEADRLAQLATNIPHEPAGFVSKTTPAAPERIQRSACAGCAGGTPCADCADEEEEEKPVQLKALPAQPSSSSVLGSGHLSDDGGAPLASNVREKVEPLLGVDLSRVQVHTGPAAESVAHTLGAKAFTNQHHIWLGANQSPFDVTLMAHESVHVVQQSSGTHRPQLIQRQPVAEQVEDGAAVRARMQQKIDEALGKPHAEEDTSPPAGGSTAKSDVKAGAAPKPAVVDPEARRAATEVNRSELEQKKGELEPEARPAVDRAAEQKPRVEEAARSTIEHIDEPPGPQPTGAGPQSEAAPGGANAPAEPGAAGPEAGAGQEAGAAAAKKAEAPGAGVAGAAQAAAGLADQAFAAADSQSSPDEPAAVVPPPAVDPLDAKGQALAPDPEADLQVLDLASQAQELRERGLILRQQATEARGNAELLRGNLGLVQQGISHSEQSVQTAQGHLAFRRGLVDKANTALGISEQKASTVGAQAPDGVTKSAEGKGKSGPLASGASDLAAENKANTPDDAEAAKNAQEQGGKMDQVGSDSGKVDDAMGQAQSAAGTLVKDAAQATQVNTQSRAKVDAVQGTLDRTDEKLGTMEGQNAQASSQVDDLREQPDAMSAQADQLDAEGQALIEASQDLEAQLHRVQKNYATGMRSVPGVEEPPSDSGATGPEMVVQRAPEDGGAATAVVAPPAGLTAAPEAGAVPSEQTAEPPQPINIAAGVPSWLTGEEDPTTPAAQREAQRRQEEETKRRRAEIAEINALKGGHFERLTAADKMDIALRQTGRRLFGGVGSISWPGWGGLAKGAGHLALGLIDPRGPLMGVVGGINMIVNGVAAFYRQPSWGGALKMAADIATGLTIILGSITALAGVIIAIMTAITILSLGTAAPITGPVIAFCATVMSTVGTWTFWVGAVALLLQELVFLKDLYAAATAKTAEELQQSSEHMSEDASKAGTVVMQMGMAKLAGVGGRAMQAEIRAAGGGVRFAAQMGARGLPARAVTGIRQAGARGYVTGAVQSAGRGAMQTARGLVKDIRADGLGRRMWGGIKSGARDTWKGLTAEHAAPPGESGLSRDFLVGKDIPPGGARAASAEARAAARQELTGGMRAGAAEGEVELAGTSHEAPSTREASVKESGQVPNEEITGRQLKNESDYVAEHPAAVTGEPPQRRAKIGQHEWEEQPNGSWCRHSNGALCAKEFAATRAVQRLEDVKSPVRGVGETDAAYEARLQKLLGESPASDAEIQAFLQREADIEKRLSDLRARRVASEASLKKTSPNEDWHVDPLPGGRKVKPLRPEEPLNPTNMSIDDINELKAHLELRTPKPQREIDWLAHEAEYRKTRGAIGASEKEYAATVGPARGKVDLADQALVERAVSRGETVMAVRSQEEAERIFHTMDEMARRPESGFKMAASKGEGDLPFRGPEHHPFPERGATRATHFNVEYVHEGRQVNLHIYWTPVP